MQGTGQPSGVIPGPAGSNAYNALLFQAQGQLPGGQAIFAGAPRLALVQGGSRPTAVNAAALAAAAQGAAYRAPPMHPSMLKPPPRKTGGGQQKGRKHCNCKNSRCLKLYCECFASGRYCDNCNCVNCFNNKESESVRQSAVEAILERNPNAFRPKIQTAEGDTHPQSIRNAPDGTVRHTKGCNCKKSSCLKKYCECFQGGIFCTEICKCVDCKNYDGSEARAQVLSIQHDPFNIHQLHQAAAAHAAQTAIKRQRLQVQQPLLQQGGQAGLLQAHNALQQLAVAAAAGGPGAPSMPLQQLQALSAVAAAPAAPSAAAAAAAAAAAPPPPPAPPPRHPLLDVVHDLVKPNVIEELCQLLILVAKEEADKQQQQQVEQQEQQQQQDDTVQQQKAAAHTTDGLLNGVKQEDEHEGSIAAAAPAAAGTADGADMETEQQQQGVKADADAVDADGDSEMQEAKPLLDDKQQQEQQEQRDGSAVPGQPAVSQPAVLSDAYTAQEAVVLQEFNAILQRIIAQADKKANSLAAASATAAAATAVATAAGGSSTAVATPAAAAAAATSQAPPASTTAAAAAGDAADQQPQQQQQQPKPVAQPMAIRPPVLAFQQQQAMMFANPNLALQLQASRQAAFLSNVNAAAMAAAAGGTGGGQQLAAYPGGLGMHLQGLRPMGMNMQQMVQVLAQDGSVHHIPAASLMSLLPTAQAAPAAAPQAAAVSAAMPAASAPTAVAQGLGAAAAAAGGAAPPASAAPAGAGVSMLSLLNSAINTGTSNAAGGGL